MLLDERNYKAPPAIAQPSVAGFKAWLELQPREGTFQYCSGCNCAAAQYLKYARYYCPRPIGKDKTARACIAAGNCGCDNKP